MDGTPLQGYDGWFNVQPQRVALGCYAWAPSGQFHAVKKTVLSFGFGHSEFPDQLRFLYLFIFMDIQ